MFNEFKIKINNITNDYKKYGELLSKKAEPVNEIYDFIVDAAELIVRKNFNHEFEDALITILSYLSEDELNFIKKEVESMYDVFGHRLLMQMLLKSYSDIQKIHDENLIKNIIT